MKWIAVLFVIASLARIGRSEVVEDGLYWMSSEQSGKPVPTQAGRTVGVANKCNFKINEASLSSQNNANDQFYLSVTIPFEDKLKEQRTVLVCGGLAFPQTSAGSNANETSSIGMPISGQDKAEALAKLFGNPRSSANIPDTACAFHSRPTKRSTNPAKTSR